MPTSADHPLVLTLEDGIVSAAKFGTVPDNILKLSMTRHQIPDIWDVRNNCLKSVSDSTIPPTAKKTILARLRAFHLLGVTRGSADGFKAKLIAGITQAASILTVKTAIANGSLDTDGQIEAKFIPLIQGPLLASMQAYLPRVVDWAKTAGGPGAPIDFTADSRRRVKEASYNGTVHWTGHGNRKDLLSYPAGDHTYWALPVTKLADLLLQQDAAVKPTLLIFNSCNTGNQFIFTMRDTLKAHGDLPEDGITLNAPLTTASGAEVSENLKKWRDGEIALPWPSVASTKD